MTQLPSGREAYHNGDYSGKVRFEVPMRDTGSYADTGGEVAMFEVPFDDLKHLVLDWFRQRMIRGLESADADQLLGMFAGVVKP